MSLSVGRPHNGWQLRAKKLRRTPHLRIKSGSQGENYGHPSLVLMLKRSALDMARAVPGSTMLVGDLSAKYGGPLSGHRSHQSGRDADVGFYVKKNGRRAKLNHFVAFSGNGKAIDGSGYEFDDRSNYLLVQSWVRDKRAGITHVFVSSALRKRLIDYARGRREFRKHLTEVQILLKQPENSSAHNDHFHVRVTCPKRQQGLCIE
jgi:penicillin-insensitive murein endopeptidase